MGIHVAIEAGRTMVNNGKRFRDPIFREHSLDNVVRVCQPDWANDIHSRRDECFISNEPHRYPCKEKRLANLGIFCKASHPGGVGSHRSSGWGYEEWMENFMIVEECMYVQQCTLKLRDESYEISEHKRVVTQAGSHCAQQCASGPSKHRIAFECGGHGCARPAAVLRMT